VSGVVTFAALTRKGPQRSQERIALSLIFGISLVVFITSFGEPRMELNPKMSNCRRSYCSAPIQILKHKLTYMVFNDSCTNKKREKKERVAFHGGK
jgi:hypothetical protein